MSEATGEGPARPESQAPELVAIAAGAPQRVEAIVDAAMEAASHILEDAEARAIAYVEERRASAERAAQELDREILGPSESLLRRAEALLAGSEQLLDRLQVPSRRG